MRVTLTILVAASLALVLADAAHAQGKLDDAVKKYLAAKSDAERDALDAALAAHDGLTTAAYRRAIEKTLRFSDMTKERRPIVRSVDIGDDRKVEVLVQLPRGYDPRTKAWPLLIAFMGPSTNGRGSLDSWISATKEYIVASATLPADDTGYAGRPCYETALKTFGAMLDLLSAELRVDTNRVFVTGHSHGASIAWFSATYYADRVTGAIPVAGLSPYNPDDVANLFGTSVFLIHGCHDAAVPVARSRDSAGLLEKFDVDHLFHEFTGGHEFPVGKMPEILRWMGTKERKPLPLRVRHATSGQWNAKGRFFFVQVVRPSPLDNRGVDLTATIDPTANRIELALGGADAFDLLLNDRLVDPTREITVTLNGDEVFRGNVPFRARAALDSYRARRDLETIYPGVLRLEVK